MKKTLIILSHPNLEFSKYNKALIDGIKDIKTVTIRYLDELYGSDIKAFDVKKEQELLLEHDRIIFQFPWYWYSSPAMIKAYQDEVFSYNFAYGSKGDKLNAKEFKVVTTIGAPDYSYQEGGWNKKSMNELLSPFQSMCNLTGMIYTRAFKLHGVANLKSEVLKQKIEDYKNEILNDDWGNGLKKYLRVIENKSV